jgi:hypothetical protein
MAVAYEPMRLVRSTGEGFPLMKRPPEGATKTFKFGVPIMLASGLATEVTFSGADIVYGVSSEAAHNLAVAATAEELSIETPPNQASAKVIPVGAPIKDGTIGCYAANGANEFSIMLKDGQVYTAALNGGTYGITKDGTTGFWYVDTAVTTGNSAVVQIIGLDSSSPNTVAAGARVFVRFLSTKRVFA